MVESHKTKTRPTKNRNYSSKEQVIVILAHPSMYDIALPGMTILHLKMLDITAFDIFFDLPIYDYIGDG